MNGPVREPGLRGLVLRLVGRPVARPVDGPVRSPLPSLVRAATMVRELHMTMCRTHERHDDHLWYNCIFTYMQVWIVVRPLRGTRQFTRQIIWRN